MTFEELGILPDYIRALDDLGFVNPMPVQEQVIPLLLKEKTDIIALAQTGTGKTAAFGLPLLQNTSVHDRYPQALILSPTRELCVQIANDLTDYSKYSNDLHILPVYGGSSIENQMKSLKKGVHIVVATPGRLQDLIRRKAIKLNQIRTVVLDEADEMLNMGFLDSINEILAEVPEDRNTLLFSATMPREIAGIAKNYMHHPAEITIGNRNAGAENIRHLYFTVHARDKYLALKRIVDYYPSIYGIVFCRTRKETQEVADKLIQDGYNAESLHGELSQAQRDMVMQKFRIRHIRLLVATDVAARGIDVDDLTHIINYNLPDDLEVYTHRSGRTGRAGKAGTSIAIINLKEKHLIRQIEKKINKPFVYTKVPGGREVCERQLFNFIDKMENVDLEHQEIDSYLPTIYRKLEWLEKEDVIKRFVALEFNRFLEYYKKAKDINVAENAVPERDSKFREGGYSERRKGSRDSRDGGSRERSGSGEYGRRERGNRDDASKEYGSRDGGIKEFGKRERGNRDDMDDVGFSKLKITLGKEDGMNPGGLIELVNSNTKGKMIPLGKISLMRNSTVFEVSSSHAQALIKTLKNARYRGDSYNIGFANEKAGREDKRASKPESGEKDNDWQFAKKNKKRKERY
jgi:ATP-dependent RNA helicase DeaD